MLIIIINAPSNLLAQVQWKPYLTIFGLESTLLSHFPVTVGDSRMPWKEPGLWWHRLAFPLFLNFILACDLTSPFKSSALRKVNMDMDETTHIKCLASWLVCDGFIINIRPPSIWHFPGGPVAEKPPANAGDVGLIPALEDSICWGAARPVRRNDRGPHAFESGCCSCWAHGLQLLRPTSPRACAPQLGESPQWEAWTLQLENNPSLQQLEKARAWRWRPSAAKDWISTY